MLNKLARVLLEPMPLRLQMLKTLDRAFNFLPYRDKLNIGSIDRANYGHCL
jgi:hypothetical protein